MTLRHAASLGVVTSMLLIGAACDTDQSFLFPNPIEDVPGVQHLGVLEPVALRGSNGDPAPTREAIEESVIYGEVGPTGTTATGGITFEFTGVGGDVCIFVDPELVFWNQSVSPITPVAQFSEPDNSFDDADIDLRAGQKIFYTGTPEVELGNFVIRFDDSLGNEVPLDLIDCSRPDLFDNPGGLAGRGTPEYCTLRETFVGVEYTVVLEAWATPLDDDRAAYGLLFTLGDCGDMLNFFNVTEEDIETRECIIRGEAIVPGNEQGARAAAAELPPNTWIGASEVPTWPGSIAFEDAFCGREVDLYCQRERRRLRNDEDAKPCAWELDLSDEAVAEEYQRCYCGDILDTPRPGGE